MSSPSKHSILVVNDLPGIRESLGLLLVSSGYDKTTFRDSQHQELDGALPETKWLTVGTEEYAVRNGRRGWQT
jgi:hypothetical protein